MKFYKKFYNLKKGDVFLLPSRENLIEFGWNLDPISHSLIHPVSPVSITTYMFDKLGTLVTIDCKDNIFEGCYFITRVTYNYTWPIDLLNKQMTKYRITPDGCSKFLFEPCEEGMTPMDGYFICKYCGENMRKIHKK